MNNYLKLIITGGIIILIINLIYLFLTKTTNYAVVSEQMNSINPPGTTPGPGHQIYMEVISNSNGVADIGVYADTSDLPDDNDGIHQVFATIEYSHNEVMIDWNKWPAIGSLFKFGGYYNSYRPESGWVEFVGESEYGQYVGSNNDDSNLSDYSKMPKGKHVLIATFRVRGKKSGPVNLRFIAPTMVLSRINPLGEMHQIDLNFNIGYGGPPAPMSPRPSTSETLPSIQYPNVYLNEATGKSCDQLCAENTDGNIYCRSVGTKRQDVQNAEIPFGHIVTWDNNHPEYSPSGCSWPRTGYCNDIVKNNNIKYACMDPWDTMYNDSLKWHNTEWTYCHCNSVPKPETTPIPDHKICTYVAGGYKNEGQGGMACISVSGDGPDLCSTNFDCQGSNPTPSSSPYSTPTHLPWATPTHRPNTTPTIPPTGTLIKGDINGNNKVDISDAVLEIDFIFGNATVGDSRIHANAKPDVDGNSLTNISDVLEIIKIIFNT